MKVERRTGLQPMMSRLPGTSEQNTNSSFSLAQGATLSCKRYEVMQCTRGGEYKRHINKLPTIMEEWQRRYLTFPVQSGKLIKS